MSAKIINRGRGPEIEGTHITVYDVLDYTKQGWHRDRIAALFRLSSRDIQAALEYIDQHYDEVTASYQRIRARQQEYPYTPDDGSSDQTGACVEQFLADQAVGPRIQLVRNPVRVGALENLYRHIHTCEDQEIVMLLDGDDWLAHRRVLQTLNAVYADPDCWMTYGQYASWPAPVPGYSRPIPVQVTETHTFREYDWCASHLRSFYAWLFKRIHREDLISPWGTFYPMAWDQALMLPMLEMAGHRAKFIPEVLYTYNTANPINDAKVNRSLQRQCETAIRQQKPYDRLASDPSPMPL